ncbi:unnamed protein product [Citrullus colocynthis]|uniref:Uncharacterized protein n=1 Tax=Citrullus colocynthis TaxID=252529 RepID=A0ABP0YFD3_9ROSI
MHHKTINETKIGGVSVLFWRKTFPRSDSTVFSQFRSLFSSFASCSVHFTGSDFPQSSPHYPDSALPLPFDLLADRRQESCVINRPPNPDVIARLHSRVPKFGPILAWDLKMNQK